MAVPEQCHAELAILVPAGGGLGHEQVYDVQTVADAAVRGCVLDPVHPLQPTRWKDCGLRPDALGVVAEGLMELRTLAQRTFDPFSQFRYLQRVDVRCARVPRVSCRASGCRVSKSDALLESADLVQHALTHRLRKDGDER